MPSSSDEGSTPSLFLGVVTHPRSRFNVDGDAGVQTRSLADRLEQRGISVQVLVSDRDDYDEQSMPMSRATLVSSAVHEAALEHRWRRYLAAGGADMRPALLDAGAWAAMTAKRVAASMGSRPFAAVRDLPGTRTVTRLINIDLSHLRVMSAALDSGAPWALVLEDDARVDDADAAASRLAWLLTALGPTPVAFASLSESLSLDELGVGALLAPAEDLSPAGSPVTLLRASRPITNTVCATLYRREYLERLRDGILARGLNPAAPIDWRVNEVIMDLHEQGLLTDGSCVWASPGIFVQGSMHA